MGKATRVAYGEALVELGKVNKDVVVLDADLSKSTKTAGFAAEYPERFFNMGIAEQNMYGTAAGLATAGKIPFASTFAMFAAGRAFEIIRNSICYPKLNVKICATHAGVSVGPDGASHQAIEDIALMRSIPNMTVLSPADAESANALIKAAAEYYGPVYVRLGRLNAKDLYEAGTEFKIGKANKLHDGTDVTIISTGLLSAEALEAAKALKEDGISVRVLDMHTIKPIDEKAIIEAANETKVIITAEEHNIIGGLGSAVSEVVCENAPTKVVRVGVNDRFGESGDPHALLEKFGFTAENLIKVVKESL